MSVTAEKLERSIRELSVREMVELHERIIAAIQESEEARGLDPAFHREIKGRLKEIDAGSAKGVGAFRALQKM